MAVPRAHRVPSPREDAPRAHAMTRDYSVLMRQVASLLGYDPRLADRRGLARYRARECLKVDFGRGTFTDFEAGVGGGVFDFIQHVSGEEARIWLKSQGLVSGVKRYSPLRKMAAREITRKADLGAEPRDLTHDEK